MSGGGVASTKLLPGRHKSRSTSRRAFWEFLENLSTYSYPHIQLMSVSRNERALYCVNFIYLSNFIYLYISIPKNLTNYNNQSFLIIQKTWPIKYPVPKQLILRQFIIISQERGLFNLRAIRNLKLETNRILVEVVVENNRIVVTLVVVEVVVVEEIIDWLWGH